MPYDWSSLPDEFLAQLHAVEAKRAKTVIDHILEHGFVTTEILKTKYGYDHPPRAIRDVRELGIPLSKFSVKSSSGRTIAAYTFDVSGVVVVSRTSGRAPFRKQLKADLYAASEGRCALCGGQFSSREMQIDHRVPYAIAGDAAPARPGTSGYMLVCGSCNRTKSWSCEHCPNWMIKDQALCLTCYWAYPADYEHVATRKIRRADLIWEADEVAEYEALQAIAGGERLTLGQTIKSILKKFIDRTARLFFTW